MFAILIVNGALESGLRSNEIVLFSTVEIGDDCKQVESCEPGNTREQSETFLKTLAAEHQGRFTAIQILSINYYSVHETISSKKNYLCFQL